MNKPDAIPEPTMDQAVKNFFIKLEAITDRRTEDCPHCGKHVSSMIKIGRCVYARPCDCRLWQGQIPQKWITKKEPMKWMPPLERKAARK